MPPVPVLKKALALLRAGKYDRVLKLLEPETFNYQDSFQYFHILGLACLYAGDTGGAFAYFGKARNLRFKEPGPLLGLAFLYLRRGDTKRAAGLYLDAADISPKDKTARRALAFLRRHSGEELSAFAQSKKARRLYPPIPGGRRIVRRFLPPLAAALAIVLAAGGVFYSREKLFPEKPARAGAEAAAVTLSGEEKSAAVETGGVYREVLTVGEVLALFDEARGYFNDYRDEKAKYVINRILLSNASLPVKNKARLLKSLTAAPTLPGLRDRFTYAEVKKDPALYEDCYVNWKGMAANIVADGKTFSFDFLINYDTRKVVEGIVPVFVPFAYDLNTETPFEVLGKVNADGGTLTLEAQTIHLLPANK